MGRHAKTAAKVSAATPPKPDPKADASPSLADVEDGLREAFDAARDLVRAGDAPVQVLRELGGLGRAITTVQAERRAQTKAREYTAKNLPREVLLEALRLMPTDELVVVRREIDAMLNTESVLG